MTHAELLSIYNEISEGTATLNDNKVVDIQLGGTGAKTAAEAVEKLGAAAKDHSHLEATRTDKGFLSAGDKIKLDGVETNANFYIHPATHPAAIINGLATVATSGLYSDLSNPPALKKVATSGLYSDLSDSPALAKVATSGDYNDLLNRPVPGPASGGNADTVNNLHVEKNTCTFPYAADNNLYPLCDGSPTDLVLVTSGTEDFPPTIVPYFSDAKWRVKIKEVSAEVPAPPATITLNYVRIY